MSGSPIRQDYLETAIKWISDGNIEDYMARNQHEKSAAPLWGYFMDVIDWIEATFTRKRKRIMKGGRLGQFVQCLQRRRSGRGGRLKRKTQRLIHDDDVTSQKGIYPYILTGEEKYLNIRAFTDGMKQRIYEKQNGKCVICGKSFDISDMEADHIRPWVEGGKTVEENCQMLCRKCNREKAAS